MSVRQWVGAPSRERGQALAEFAIVLPLILLFIAAVLEFGRAWNIKQAVTDAAREGARYAAVMEPAMTVEDVEAKIEERLALSSIETSTIVISSPDPNMTDWFHTDDGTGKEINVSVSTTHQMPLVHVLLKWAGVPSTVTINTDATMRHE